MQYLNPAKFKYIKYLIACVGIFLTTFIIKLIHADSSPINIPLFYLLAVQVIALFLGKRPAILASFVAFLSFDYYFIDPKYILTVSNPSEFLALCLFLTTSIIIGQLTAKLQSKVQEANQREKETLSIARASLAIASQIDFQKSLNKIIEEILTIKNTEKALLIFKNENSEYDSINISSININDFINEYKDALDFVFTNATAINDNNSAIWQKGLNLNFTKTIMFLPVATEGYIHAVLYLEFNDNFKKIDFHQQKLIDTLINHAGIVFQRELLSQEEAKLKAVTQTEKLKTTLLHMVSHDFKSPLASIKTAISTLLYENSSQSDSPMDKDTVNILLNTIDSQADRLNKLIGNIIDYSKLEANLWTSYREIIPIGDFVSSLLNSFNQDDLKRIEVKIEPNIHNLYIDQVQMEQAIKNLLENALKYSGPDKMVKLKFCLLENNFDIIVSDSGPGILKNDSKQLFDLFYRGSKFQESNLPGIGMGLAITKGLTEAHNGTLTAYNKADQGAEFRLRFPLEIHCKEDRLIENTYNR